MEVLRRKEHPIAIPVPTIQDVSQQQQNQKHDEIAVEIDPTLDLRSVKQPRQANNMFSLSTQQVCSHGCVVCELLESLTMMYLVR